MNDKAPEKENTDEPQEEFISNEPPSATENENAPQTAGDEPMTPQQHSALKPLSQEARVEFDDSLSKAEASKTIEALQEQTGRGSNTVRE